jgi:hypothetical protein
MGEARDYRERGRPDVRQDTAGRPACRRELRQASSTGSLSGGSLTDDLVGAILYFSSASGGYDALALDGLTASQWLVSRGWLLRSSNTLPRGV